MDLIRFARAVGGLDNVATVIAEMSLRLRPKRLVAAVRATNDIPCAQRLGFVLDQLRERHLSNPIHEWLQRQGPRSVPLAAGRAWKGSVENRRWRLQLNSRIEVES